MERLGQTPDGSCVNLARYNGVRQSPYSSEVDKGKRPMKEALLFCILIWVAVGILGFHFIVKTLTGPSSDYGEIWWSIAFSSLVWGGIFLLMSAGLSDLWDDKK
jgi:hypothetical protein